MLFRYQQKIAFSLVAGRHSWQDTNDIVLENVDLLYDIHIMSPSQEQLRTIIDLSPENAPDNEIGQIEEVDLSWRHILANFDHSESQSPRSTNTRYDHKLFPSQDIATVVRQPYLAIQTYFDLPEDIIYDNVDDTFFSIDDYDF